MLGKQVYGYDKTPSSLIQELEREGMKITFNDAVSELPSQFSKEDTLVVYTPAIPKDSRLLNHFMDEGFEVVKRAKLLGEVTKNTLCLAVAGTHGKTTTSAILGHLLAECNMPVTAFLGGIAENYHSNFISKGTEITVVEADEFDRSFLQLQPDIACITSMDADHLDIYGDASSIEESFKAFSKLVPKKEHMLFKKGLPLEGRTVAVGEPADFEAQNVRIENGAYVFDLKTPFETLTNLQFLLPGHHNLHNAVTALGMAITAGTPTPGLPKALFNFKGVERRFSYKIKTEKCVLIDDYAHHPTEIDALFQAVSEMYPNDEKLIVFQPHLFSRTRDFAEGFAKSLSKFDEIMLLEIYPARELPLPGIHSQWLLGQIPNPKKELITKEDLGEKMKNTTCKIKLMVGAGDIGVEVEKITKILTYEG
ncbi:MAG: cyanophycin synthetase [Flavobacteriaceae bacterium]